MTGSIPVDSVEYSGVSRRGIAIFESKADFVCCQEFL
jgi:hypothetical protein